MKLEIIWVTHFLWLFVAIKWRCCFCWCCYKHKCTVYHVTLLSWALSHFRSSGSTNDEDSNNSFIYMEHFKKSLKSSSWRHTLTYDKWVMQVDGNTKEWWKISERLESVKIHTSAPYVAVTTFLHSLCLPQFLTLSCVRNTRRNITRVRSRQAVGNVCVNVLLSFVMQQNLKKCWRNFCCFFSLEQTAEVAL